MGFLAYFLALRSFNGVTAAKVMLERTIIDEDIIIRAEEVDNSAATNDINPSIRAVAGYSRFGLIFLPFSFRASHVMSVRGAR